MALEDVLGLAASAASILCQLVGLQICMKIVQKGGTDLISPVPFISFFLNAALWVKYGLLQNNSNLVLTNSVGAVLQMIYTFIFYVYTSRKSHMHRLLVVAALILFSPLLYLQYLGQDLGAASYSLGMVCCCLTVATYMSPLASLKDVCRSKSVESMSFLLVMFNFVAAVCWFSYGTMLNDAFVALPNLLGLMFGFLQLFLFCIYPSSRPKSKTFASTIAA
ncbi:hypothetical protein ACOMHN_006121 [Nucella lapillus]